MIRDLLARLRTIDERNLMAWAGKNWMRKIRDICAPAFRP
jgi:hypothetical protein